MGSQSEAYNYAVFPPGDDVDFFRFFAEHLKPGDSAPDADLLDLDSGEMIALRDITRNGLTVIELGSFT